MNQSIEISLTDFVDFVSKSGSPKLTKVKQIKTRPDYHPAQDFYKILRDGLQQYHENGADSSELDKILENLNDKRKLQNYAEIITGYKKFLGKKTISTITPPYDHWKIGKLDVRINPEIGLKINGESHIIKLYFKSEDLSKNKITQILALMHEVLSIKGKDFIFSILDVRKSKLHSFDESYKDLLPLLKGEANSFETIWLDID